MTVDKLGEELKPKEGVENVVSYRGRYYVTLVSGPTVSIPKDIANALCEYMRREDGIRSDVQI